MGSNMVMIPERQWWTPSECQGLPIIFKPYFLSLVLHWGLVWSRSPRTALDGTVSFPGDLVPSRFLWGRTDSLFPLSL